jgi:hypothetical protein
MSEQRYYITEAMAEALRDVIARVRGMKISGPGVDFTNTNAGIACVFDLQTMAMAAATPIVRYRIKSIQNNYVTCRTWDGTTEGTTDVLIAKPRKLRHVYGNYPGLTSLTTVDAQTGTATNGTITETWIVTPAYVVDDDLWAVTVAATGVTDGSGNAIVNLDVNDDARAWAVQT